jgi:Na+/proline symporter
MDGVVEMEAQAENVLPWAAYNFLPPWASILFIVSLAAAIVSTSGDNVLIVSTLIGHNIYRNIKPNCTNVQVLKVVRIFVPITALLAMSIALYFETVYKLIVLSGGIQLATISGAYIIGMFWKKANTAGAVSSFFTGLISWIILFIFWAMPATDYFEEDAIFIAMVPAAAISFLTLVIVSLATQKKYPPKPMRTQDGEDMTEMPKFFWSKSA